MREDSRGSIKYGGMTGRVEKRYESSWTIIIELGYDKATKERKRIVESYQDIETEEAAWDRVQERMYEIKHKKYIKRNNATLGQYLDEWLELRKSKLAPKTYASYRGEINGHIKPSIGNIPLQDLEPMDLQEYYFKMETEGRNKKADKKDRPPGLSQRTIHYHHRILSAALKQAVKWKKIPYNPASFVDTPTYEKKEMQFLRKNELYDFLQSVSEHIDYRVMYVAVMTGMRQGEILGLRWQDVDFDLGVIYVRQQLQYLPGQGYFYKSPKSKKSKRTIPMQLPLSKMLREIKKEQIDYIEKETSDLMAQTDVGEVKEEDIKRIYEDNDLVFCQKNGKPWDPGNITNRFKDAIIKFGKPNMRFHDLRHTFAALSLAAGISMDKLQILMGHESITTTIDMYGHIPDDVLTGEMAKLSQYLGFEVLAK